jgi:hypothetical protein
MIPRRVLARPRRDVVNEIVQGRKRERELD